MSLTAGVRNSGNSFQSNVGNFCRGFSCCLYYRGVRKRHTSVARCPRELTVLTALVVVCNEPPGYHKFDTKCAWGWKLKHSVCATIPYRKTKGLDQYVQWSSSTSTMGPLHCYADRSITRQALYGNVLRYPLLLKNIWPQFFFSGKLLSLSTFFICTKIIIELVSIENRTCTAPIINLSLF